MAEWISETTLLKLMISRCYYRANNIIPVPHSVPPIWFMYRFAVGSKSEFVDAKQYTIVFSTIILYSYYNFYRDLFFVFLIFINDEIYDDHHNTFRYQTFLSLRYSHLNLIQIYFRVIR